MSNYPTNRWRPTRSRPVLTAAQLRELKELGYLGPCWLHEDEAAELLRLFRGGKGSRKR